MPSVAVGPSIAAGPGIASQPGISSGPGIDGATGVTYPLLAMASAVYDFANNRFMTRSAGLNTPFTQAAFASLFTYTGSNGTRVNSSGLIEAAVTNQPRFDYDPVTLAPKGILIEEARTNLCLQSEDFATTWALQGGGVISVSTNATTAPSGAATADKLVGLAVSSSVHRLAQMIATADTVVHTASVYLKAAGYSFAQISIDSPDTRVTVDLSNGTVTSSTGTTGTIQALSNGWYRVMFSYTAGASSVLRIWVFDSDANSQGRLAYTGDGTSGIYAWGAQLEAGSFITSHIPTTSAAVTRTADVCTRTLGAEFNAVAGTIYGQAVFKSAVVDPFVLSIDDTTASERLAVLGQSSSSKMEFYTGDGGVSQADLLSTVVSKNTASKSASAYAVNDFAISANGGTVSTDASGTLPTVTRFLVGNNSGSNQAWNSTIAILIYYPSRLSDAQLQSIST